MAEKELELRNRYIHEIKNDAIRDKIYPWVKLISDVTENVVDYLPSLEEVDDFLLDEEDRGEYKECQIHSTSIQTTFHTLNIYFAEFLESGKPETLTKEHVLKKVQLMSNFVHNVFANRYNERNDSASEKQVAINIKKYRDEIKKLKCIYISTDLLEENVDTNFKTKEKFRYQENGYNIEYDVEVLVIDIKQIIDSKYFNHDINDKFEINVWEYGTQGLQCVRADVNSPDYEAYLGILPGKFLANIYLDYAEKLLSANVRSFLKNTKINKQLRTTIIKESDKFFAYNNGISAIATDVTVEEIEGKGLCITKLCGLKIINGGQTTASIASAVLKDKADLSNIYIMMKLTKLKEKNDDLILNISTYANSQNKVTSTDLNSNHPFYQKIKDISRRLRTPSTSASPLTYWYFEQSKGSYEQNKMDMNSSEIKDFGAKYPKSQLFKIQDIAKWVNSEELKPFWVAKGGELNAGKFHETIASKINISDVNEFYFQQLIAKGILFKCISDLITDQQWYIERKAYRAQLTPLVFSKLIYEINSKGYVMDYQIIWKNQSVPIEIQKDIINIAKIACDVIYAPNKQGNIGEYCKKEECWNVLKGKLYEISNETKKIIKLASEVKLTQSNAKKEEKENDSIRFEVKIFNLGVKYWLQLKSDAIELGYINKIEEKLLDAAASFAATGKGLTTKTIKDLKVLKDKLEGYNLK